MMRVHQDTTSPILHRGTYLVDAPLACTPLASVLEEVGRWMNEGISLFARQWRDLQTKLAGAEDTS